MNTDENMVYVVFLKDVHILAIYDAEHSEDAYELAEKRGAQLKIVALNEQLDEGIASAFNGEIING